MLQCVNRQGTIKNVELQVPSKVQENLSNVFKNIYYFDSKMYYFKV